MINSSIGGACDESKKRQQQQQSLSQSNFFFIINFYFSYTMSAPGKRLSGSISFHPLKRNTEN